MYLFFVRHFNDIDHIAPIVWKMHNDNRPVAVYCMNPRYAISTDYRLASLKRQGVVVDYLYNDSDRPHGYLHDRLKSLMQRSFDRHQRLSADSRRQSAPAHRLAERIAQLTGTGCYKLLRKLFYGPAWARNFLESRKARVICFDHVMPGLYGVDALLKAARRASIPALALPHGIYLYTNEVTKEKSTDARRSAKFNRFDYIVVPNRLRKDSLVRSGVDRAKIIVLGSARFCDEWMEQNQKMVPKRLQSLTDRSAKLKAVFMTSKPQCRIDVRRMAATFDLLAGLDGIQVLLKPHTRSREDDHLFERSGLPRVAHILTAELCAWADVLLVVGSSVITEALMREKPVLYLKYLHANTTLFEELGACWTIADENELRTALQQLKKEKTAVPYGREKVDRFLAETVYGGKRKTDVLHDYEDFIVKCAAMNTATE